MEKLHTQHSPWWDWAAISLHFVLLQTVAARLVSTTWTPFLPLIHTFTSLGFVIGAVLGYSRFQRRAVGLLSFLYMLVLLPLQWTKVIDQETALEEQFLSVGGRLFVSMSDFLARRSVEDPFFFVAIMSVAFWIISSWASFTLVRNQNYLGAVLPAAVGLLIVQNYDNFSPGRLWFLAFFTFVALLLLGRLQFLRNKKSWRERRIFLSPDNTVDLTSSMALAAGLIILVAWTAPPSLSSLKSAMKTWGQITRPWQEFTQKMENAVSALDSKTNKRRGDFFFTELTLGRGFPLKDTVVFEVQIPAASDAKPPRYYWRGRVYDYFATNQWYTTGTERQEYSTLAGELALADTEEGIPGRFVFKIGETRTSLLYGPSQPVWFSRSGAILTSPAGDKRDVISWSAAPMLLPGETYQMDAVLKNPTIQDLRTAGTKYPEWVTSKYLQLPKDFSPRIQQLAQSVAAEADDTPYDKAVAITNYLRETVEYSTTVPATPGSKDTLEWILFEHKKAYCVYYATSEVLMLRSLGIPARMAVGFAEGTGFVEKENIIHDNPVPSRFVVREKNAHAWPEVYFPGIGWVEFEPTGNQTPLNRPAERQVQDRENQASPVRPVRKEEEQLPQEEELIPEEEAPVQEISRISPLVYLLPSLAAFAALTILLSRRYAFHTRVPILLRATMERSGIDVPIWIVRWEKWIKLTPIEKAFESINFGLRWLDQPAPVHITPIERAAKLSRLLPEQADEIKILLDEHQTSLYTSRTGDVTQARHAAHNIRKQVIVQRIRHMFLGKPLH